MFENQPSDIMDCIKTFGIQCFENATGHSCKQVVYSFGNRR